MHPIERGGSLLLDAGLAAEDTVRLADTSMDTTTETAPAASMLRPITFDPQPRPLRDGGSLSRTISVGTCVGIARERAVYAIRL